MNHFLDAQENLISLYLLLEMIVKQEKEEALLSLCNIFHTILSHQPTYIWYKYTNTSKN